MGQRQNYLESIVQKRFGSYKHTKLTNEDISDYSALIYRIYSALMDNLEKHQSNLVPGTFLQKILLLSWMKKDILTAIDY